MKKLNQFDSGWHWRAVAPLFILCFGILFCAAGAFGQTARISSPNVSATVVISEVYGGAGCGTAGCSTYQNDYIELYNRGAAAVNLAGYSVQYASATGTAWQVTALTGTIQPGRYFLIAESFGANGVNPLPAPDVTGTIAMSTTAAKVALVNSTTALTGACPTGNASVVDFIGYGAAANCVEVPTGTPSGSSTLAAPTVGQTAPAPSTTTADQRAAAGLDTDTNSTDFTASAPTPQNAAAAPTAAAVSISGRVTTPQDSGLTNALVTLIDSMGNSRTVLTRKGGNFQFTEVAAGETYVLGVSSKRYRFAPQIVTATEDLAGLSFAPMNY